MPRSTYVTSNWPLSQLQPASEKLNTLYNWHQPTVWSLGFYIKFRYIIAHAQFHRRQDQHKEQQSTEQIRYAVITLPRQQLVHNGSKLATAIGV